MAPREGRKGRDIASRSRGMYFTGVVLLKMDNVQVVNDEVRVQNRSADD